MFAPFLFKSKSPIFFQSDNNAIKAFFLSVGNCLNSSSKIFSCAETASFLSSVIKNAEVVMPRPSHTRSKVSTVRLFRLNADDSVDCGMPAFSANLLTDNPLAFLNSSIRSITFIPPHDLIIKLICVNLLPNLRLQINAFTL